MLLRKVKPELGEIKLDVTPRVEVVAYPVFDRKQIGTNPVTNDPENFKYSLSVGTNAHYIAEGSIQFPNLSEETYDFQFKTFKNRPHDHHYRLILGDKQKSSWYTGYIIKTLLDSADIGKRKHRPALTEIIDKNIQHFFFWDNHGTLPQYFGFLHVEFLLTEGERLAADSYRPTLENSLKEDSTQGILPKKYIYDCGPINEMLIPRS